MVIERGQGVGMSVSRTRRGSYSSKFSPFGGRFHDHDPWEMEIVMDEAWMCEDDNERWPKM
jgi:hypothetical protein